MYSPGMPLCRLAQQLAGDTETRYSDLEKDLSLVQATNQVAQLRRGQSVIAQGPFCLSDIGPKGAATPTDIAQKPTVSKC